MKKLIYGIATASLILIVSCQKTETPDEVKPTDPSTSDTTPPTTSTTPTTTTTTTTTPTTTTTTTTTPTTTTGVFAKDMLAAVNAIRTAGCNCGGQQMPKVAALTWNALLEKAALGHGNDMFKTGVFSHTGSGGSTMSSRVTATGYAWSALGENIAFGYKSLSDVMKGWIASSGHCKNMMSANFTQMGAARVGDYWVQDFGKPR
jgi:uncharacterized protein YkwD